VIRVPDNEFAQRKELGYQYLVDLTSGNTSYYYPVVFGSEMPTDNGETLHFRVLRPDTHMDGSSYGTMDLDAEMQRSVWGGTASKYDYRFFELSGPLSRWFGVVSNGYHGVVYLRGGRRYYVYSSARVENISNLGAAYTIRSGDTDYEITFGIQTDVNTQPPTSVPSGGTESMIWVNCVPDKSLAANANIQVPGITLTTGAGAGKLLSSDASGNASWGYTATTSVDSPGSDSNIPTEKATRTAISAHISADDHTQYLTTSRHDTTARHGSSVVDHGSIGGLSDDDHTQYLNTTRHDTTSRHTPGTVVPVVTTIGDPGSHSNIPSEAAVRAALNTGSMARAVSVQFENGGYDALEENQQVWVQAPASGTLTGLQMVADQSGSVTVDVQYATYSSYPTTYDQCGSSSKPTLSSAQKYSTDCSAWSRKTVSAGDWLVFIIESCSSITRLNISLMYA